MRQAVTGVVFMFAFLACASSVCLAQGKGSANTDRKKGSCDYITQSDAEAILGTPVGPKRDDQFGCWFGQVGWQNEPPNNKSMRLNVWNWADPQVNWYAETRKKRTATRVAGKVVKDVPDFADAAIWTWLPGYGVFDAFKAGTVWVEVSFAGISEDRALQKGKELAAKVLGGTAATGYVYATPKEEPPVVAEPKPSPAPAPSSTPGTAPVQEPKPTPAPAPVPIPVGTGKSFSQSRYINQGQFLKALKEVTLTFEGDSSLEKYVSAAEQRSTVERELAQYGISVGANAPVSVLATVTHKVVVYEKTYSRSGTEDWPIHGLTFELKFFVRAAAMRDKKLHLVAASPAGCSAWGTVVEGTSFYKTIHGDSALKEIRKEYINDVVVCLKGIAGKSSTETKPWSVMSWTEKEKAAADTEFTKIMGSRSPFDKRQLDGLETTPELSLEPTRNGDLCGQPGPSWRDLWSKAFRRVGLTESHGDPTLLLIHRYDCYFTYGLVQTHFFRVFDTISLMELNLVFELNGEVVRSAGELLSSVHHTYMLENDKESPTEFPTENYVPRSITDFLVDLATGRGNIPPIAASPVAH